MATSEWYYKYQTKLVYRNYGWHNVERIILALEIWNGNDIIL